MIHFSSLQASAFSAPGTSAHGGHPSDLPTPTANVKVPIITPHAPQLPRGPPTFMNYPQGHFAPPSAAPTQAGPQEVVVKRSNSRESNSLSSREREQQQQQQQQHQLLQHQQQQQWLAMVAIQQAAAQAAAQGTPANPQLHPSHAHFTPVTAGYPVATPTTQVHHQEHSQQQAQQPMVFTFPTQDEIMRQRLGGGQLQGTPEQQQHYMAALMQQQGVYPTAMIAGQMEANRLHEEQHGMSTPQPQIVVPMEQYMLLQQQQQQQQLQQQQAAIAAGLSPIDSNQTFIEFQRYFENTMQQVQKDPNLLQLPQVQHLLASRNAMMQQLHVLQAAGHDQHQINSVLQQHLVRIQQDQMMFQAHAQQQEAAQKKFILGRPPTVLDSTPNRSRPGVIVGK